MAGGTALADGRDFGVLLDTYGDDGGFAESGSEYDQGYAGDYEGYYLQDRYGDEDSADQDYAATTTAMTPSARGMAVPAPATTIGTATARTAAAADLRWPRRKGSASRRAEPYCPASLAG